MFVNRKLLFYKRTKNLIIIGTGYSLISCLLTNVKLLWRYYIFRTLLFLKIYVTDSRLIISLLIIIFFILFNSLYICITTHTRVCVYQWLCMCVCGSFSKWRSFVRGLFVNEIFSVRLFNDWYNGFTSRFCTVYY